MKQQLRNLGFAIATMACATSVHAQSQPADGFISMIDGVRVLVNSPSSVPSPSAITFAASGSPSWGGSLSTPVINKEVVRALGSNGIDSLMCTPAPSTSSYTNKIALLYRGSCSANPSDPNSTFTEKALKAQQGGAIAVIIVNNVPGAPVGMLAGANAAQVNIPVFMISNVDGASIAASIRNGTSVFMSLGSWGLGSANDVAIMPKSSASMHAGAIPLSQLASSNGNPTAYRMFNGAMAVNFGTATQTSIKNSTTIQWTPTGGAATQVYTDTAVLASLSAADSLDLDFNLNFHNPHTSSKGMYTVTSRIVPSGADAITTDNSETRMVYVTDSIYCKGAWNNTTMRPDIVSSRRADETNLWSWGPLFYTAVGGAYPSKLQFTLATVATIPTLDQYGAFICAFKWTDGSNGGLTDGILETGELKLIAQGYRGFTTADSSFSDIVVPFSPSLGGGAPAIEPLASNSWYYYTVSPSDPSIFLGIDNKSNDYMRMFLSNRISPATREYLSPQYLGEATQIPNGGTGSIRMIPFYLDPAVPIDSISVDLSGFTVNAALHTSSKPLSVGNQVNYIEDFNVLPNPSNGLVSLNYAFRKDMGNAMVTVINGLGQTVMTKKATGTKGTVSFDLSNAAAGSYWIIYGSSFGTESRQFQIIK